MYIELKLIPYLYITSALYCIVYGVVWLSIDSLEINEVLFFTTGYASLWVLPAFVFGWAISKVRKIVVSSIGRSVGFSCFFIVLTFCLYSFSLIGGLFCYEY